MGVKWDLTGTWLGLWWDSFKVPLPSHSSPTSVSLQFYFSQTLHIFQVLAYKIQTWLLSVNINAHFHPYYHLSCSVSFSFHLELQWHSLYVEKVMKAEIILFRLGSNPSSYAWSIRSQVNNSMHIYSVDWLLQCMSTPWDSPLPWDTS